MKLRCVTLVVSLAVFAGPFPCDSGVAAETQSAVKTVRPKVSVGENVEDLPAVRVKFFRFTILATAGNTQPCIDELEVFATDGTNVARKAKPTASSTFPGYEAHKLEHINDGQYGNARSWMPNERGGGWVQLEFAEPAVISRVAWSRDRSPTPEHHDRVVKGYEIAVSEDGTTWKTVLEAGGRATHRNVQYGPDERNVLDFWAAEGDGPRPLLVNIHGGGWYLGDKGDGNSPGDWQVFLDNGISFASITYRLTDTHPLPAPVHDAARAIQFLRSKAAEWNIDKDRIAVTGGSAGGCTSMWLLFHDDLADPKAEDPVLRESTRVTAAAVDVPQSSIEPEVIRDWVGPAVLSHPMIFKAVGEPGMDAVMQNLAKHKATFAEFSPINHLDAKDPPLFMTCWGEPTVPSKNANHGIHHLLFGVKAKEKSDAVGHECYLKINGVREVKEYPDRDTFLIQKLNGSRQK